jgi:hypothetical protein
MGLLEGLQDLLTLPVEGLVQQKAQLVDELKMLGALEILEVLEV